MWKFFLKKITPVHGVIRLNFQISIQCNLPNVTYQKNQSYIKKGNS